MTARGSLAARCGLVLLALFGAAPLKAQPAEDPSSLLARVERAYENLDYDEAEALARQALARFSLFTPDQLVRLHTTLGLIFYARNESGEAAEQFRLALGIDPTLTLDPLLVSPVTLAFFEETKADFERESTAGHSAEATVRYVVVTDPRPSAAMRSMVLPGWGQHYKGEPAKGWVLTGAWMATLIGGTAAHVRYQSTHDAYLETVNTPENPTAIEDAFAVTNRWYKARGALLLGAGAVWAYALVDAIASGGAPESPPDVQLVPTPGGAILRLRF